ncbi:flavin reductase family protein [Bradyrhizobium liaoningense]
MALEQRKLRLALSQFATGVAVITARGKADAPIGMTMSSFNSVSLDPPLVLFSVDRRALSLESMLAAEGYAVNILSRQQEDLSNQFAKASTDKWSNVSHSIGHAEAPLLAGALAHFECAPYAHYEGGDHVIFVGQVVRFSAREDDEPLVFFRGKYQSLGRQDGSEPMWPLPIHY